MEKEVKDIIDDVFQDLSNDYEANLTFKSRRLLPSRLRRATANCQASATAKNASKGESQPKHFFGLKLIDKTIFCKVSLSKE